MELPFMGNSIFSIRVSVRVKLIVTMKGITGDMHG